MWSFDPIQDQPQHRLPQREVSWVRLSRHFWSRTMDDLPFVLTIKGFTIPPAHLYIYVCKEIPLYIYIYMANLFVCSSCVILCFFLWTSYRQRRFWSLKLYHVPCTYVICIQLSMSIIITLITYFTRVTTVFRPLLSLELILISVIMFKMF